MSNKFCKKEFLKNIIRIHPPEDTQKIDKRLRLHRAERLDPFPKDFFNNFLKTINQKDFRYYPYIYGLKRSICKKYNVEFENIFLNNGSSENIRIFYKAFALKNKNVILTKPCYPMHEVYARIEEANIIFINYDSNLTWKIEDMIDKIDENTSCVCLANPNSPIGDIKSKDDIEKLLKKTQELSIPTLIDEAYVEYAKQGSCINLLKKYDNMVISKTFSKGLGCAGLRIGFLLGNKEIMQVIQKLIATYEVSGISARFGSYLLDNYHIVEEYIAKIHLEKEKLKQICESKKIPCFLNHANTIHIKVDNNEEMKLFLEKENVIYRFRKLPHDGYEWLTIVLYPNFCESNILKKIIDLKIS